MRVLLPFGSANKGSSSDTNNENCSSGEGITSTVSSSSSRNNLQAFCINCSERIEEAKPYELDSTRASGGSCDSDHLSDVPVKSEAPPGSIDEETRKFSPHSRNNSSEFRNQCNLASVSSIPDGPSLVPSIFIGSAIASELNPVSQDSQISSENEVGLPAHLSSRNHKKRRGALPSQEPLTRSAILLNSKRLRSHSSPQGSSFSNCGMAVGGRFKSDSDDDSSFAVEPQDRSQRRFWVQPAENEPPISLQNHTLLVAPSSNISEMDRREMPHSSPERLLRDGFEVSSSVNGEEDLMLARFCVLLKKQGLEMVEQEGDGNCLFRAVSLQVYGSSENHSEVRERCMDYMAHNEEHYSGFIAASSDDEVILRPGNGSMTPFQSYIARKRINGVHGNHTEIQALSELFNRPVEVYTPGSCVGDCVELQPINIFHKEYKASDPPIRLSYHDGNHYNAIIDPFVPTAGLGLGLPGLKPGLADQMQLTKAKIESDHLADEMELARVLKESREEVIGKNDDDFQRVLKDSSRDFMLEQKVFALSDLDETNFALEQKVLSSSLESYYRHEHGRKQRASVLPSTSSSRRRRGSPSPAEVDTVPSLGSYAGVPPVAGTLAVLPLASPSLSSTSNFNGATVLDSDVSSSVAEEYPQVVQELVMNGFELQDVVRAYEFVGDRFDDMLSFLLTRNSKNI